MLYLTELIFQLLYILELHAFHNNHRESAHTELIYHNILTFHCLQCVRQITQYVIICPCLDHPVKGRDQQKKSNQKDQILVLRNPFS